MPVCRLAHDHPATAIPIAPPAWREVLLIAKARPARSDGTAATAAATTAGVRIPSPMARTGNAGSATR